MRTRGQLCLVIPSSMFFQDLSYYKCKYCIRKHNTEGALMHQLPALLFRNFIETLREDSCRVQINTTKMFIIYVNLLLRHVQYCDFNFRKVFSNGASLFYILGGLVFSYINSSQLYTRCMYMSVGIWNY